MWCVIFAVILSMTGCGGSLYRVSPRVEAPISGKAGEARGGGITLRAVPLRTDEVASTGNINSQRSAIGQTPQLCLGSRTLANQA